MCCSFLIYRKKNKYYAYKTWTAVRKKDLIAHHHCFDPIFLVLESASFLFSVPC